MTYIVIGSDKDNNWEQVRSIISAYWKREITTKDIDVSNPDIHILDSSSLNSIGIEDIKNLQEEMLYKPFKEFAQISIIWDAKKLTDQAQNAFLKTLEDSSDQTVYILVVANERELLPTICSRGNKVYTKEIKDVNQEFDTKIWKQDLVTAFRDIERLSKDKNLTIASLESLRDSLGQNLHKNMKKGIYVGEINHILDIVNNSIKQVNSNCNRRLVLENLYLQLTTLKAGNRS